VFLLAALVLFAAEVLSFVLVAHQIGVLLALVLLIGVSALGPVIVRRVGIGVLAHTRDRLAGGELPTREVLDGVVVLAGGALICVPGFIGDAIGLLLMLGPVRHFLVRAAGHRLARRVQSVPLGNRWVVDARSRPVGGAQVPPAGRPLDPRPPIEPPAVPPAGPASRP
jgi:UPF0716 protein FxsA